METVLSTVLIGVMLGAQYALLALGFTLIFGILGVVNFAHGSLYMLGGYLAYAAVAKAGVPYPAAVVFATLGTAALGYLFEVWILQRVVDDHLATLILTLGFSQVIITGVTMVFGHEAPRFTFPIVGNVAVGSLFIPQDKLIVFAISAVVICAVYWLVYRTGFGRAMRALSIDRAVAITLGMNARIIFPLTVALSAGLAGLTGSLITPILSLSPHAGESVLITAFVVVILGGLGSVAGATAAAFLVGIIEAFSGVYIGGSLGTLGLFVLVIAILMFRPSGLFGASMRGA